MKILVFIKSSPEKVSGGLETQNQLLVEGLKKRGHAVEVLETQSPFGDSIDCKRIGDDVGVVISQSAAGTRFLLSRKGQTPPVVVIQHGTLLGSLRTRLRMGGFSWRLIPYAIKACILDLIRLHRCEAVIAVSNQVRKALLKEYFLKPEKVHLVYNGIEVDKLKVKNEKFKVDKTILYLGRLAKEKGLDILLNAFKKTAKLLIVGDGPQHDTLVYRTKQLGIENRVKFVGKVPYDKTPKYYQAADVFVLPSTADEGLPMTILEAMASGLPVIASRVGGISEAVVDGETGILVEPGNVEELSAALSRLLSDDNLRLMMGQKARRVAEEKFSQETMVQKTLMIIRSIVRGGEE